MTETTTDFPITHDGAYFLAIANVSLIKSPRAARRALPTLVNTLTSRQHDLLQWPDVQFDGLDLWYATLRGISALSTPLLKNLAHDLAWRGVCWAGWLLALAPQPPSPSSQRILTQRPATTHENDWASLIALARTNPSLPHDTQLANLIANARDALANIPNPPLPVRLIHSREELHALETARAQIQRIYHQHGAHAARDAILTSPLHLHTLSYPDWYRLQHDLPTRRHALDRWLHHSPRRG